MKHDWNPRQLDIRAFALAQAHLQGAGALADWPRLSEDAAQPQGEVHWSLVGQLRPVTGGEDQIWVTLKAQVQIHLSCQRCLGPVATTVMVERDFRFVADEAQAALQDEESEEDVLVWSQRFDVLDLVEDELIMALPMVPLHDSCPSLPASMAVPDIADSEKRPNPFAVLSQLREPKS